nr:putative reverse transcriptase domain-containing protein [Tanacetum cinerariifolium]
MDKENPWGKDGPGKDVELHLYRSMIGSLMYLTASRPDIIDYGGASQDRKSTTGGSQFLRRRLISWQCKKQTIVATSTTEAEYVATASCCGQVKNEVLVVKGNEGVSRLKVISCIKARKYMEKGSQLFLAHVTEEALSKKQLQDVPVICDFLEVFPDDLPGHPPPRQVKLRIELVPGASPIARAPYRLVSLEMNELADQLKELSEKGFIRSRSSS